MDQLVAPTQSAFLKGRQLVDGVVVINEVVDLAKRTGQSCLIFKVDFERAYDSVDWSFLDYMLDRFGFCSKWKGWIRTCVFAGNMSVLVNGSPSEEINIQRGLKQGDPLAPFLFLLVAEGLGGIMKKAVELRRFNGFRVGSSDLVVSHLQYADDTLCIGEASVMNLWSLKAILRGFEMCSGLKINFWKSSLVGVNVSPDFLRVASVFLNCRTSSLPFKYLGLPVGANPQRASTWEPLLVALRKRLGLWANKYVSLGGRIVLLNSVLNAIPIFYLSYMKIPVHVWKQVRRIQREFLWGGKRGRKKINWIKWDVVCLPKKKGGLGVRDVRAVNISLLTKWRWRLLHDDAALWKDMLKSKYGAGIIGRTELGEDYKPWFASLWWRDICSMGNNLGLNWFSQAVRKKLGNGVLTSFWRDIWVGEIPLCDRFPRLFSMSTQKEASVADVRNQISATGEWRLEWRRRFFEWEKLLFNDLLQLINTAALSIEEEDRWVWLPEGEAVFSVKSTYRIVAAFSAIDCAVAQCFMPIFTAIWKCPAPSKVSGFVWQLLHGRIPTRNNLMTRRILDATGDVSCALCGEEMETELHLFLYCEIASLVWVEIFNWLEVPFGLPHNLFSLFYCLMEAGSHKIRRRMIMIASAVVWNLWNCRNSLLFDNGSGSVAELVEAVKISSWKWWMSRNSNTHCLLYEWRMEPRLCMLN
jgi:hypothetical protein